MLFQKNILRKYLSTLPAEQIAGAWERYRCYFLNADIQQNILQSKEEQFQEGFLRELFVKVLGYTLNPSPDFNLITEQKNETNSKKADGAILIEEKVVGIIELKDHKTPDLSKVETQAFGYKNQHPDARLVIISNFEKLRLYIDNTVEHREWNLFTLTEQDFRELYLCLAFEQVKQETALKMKQESVSSEDQITKALYRDYSQFKRALFADILKNNPTPEGKDERDWTLLLFKKTQKLLDRLLFIFFAEDCGLLPPNMVRQIIDDWEKLKKLDEYRTLYYLIKKYFGYINTGFEDKKIFAYNGGLFKPDEVLDNIQISDEVLVEHTKRLSTYDFESEVDVNILGHIFENSLSEIEEVTLQIEAGLGSSPVEAGRALVSKRKQDGVFYTPQYITKYIVENTIGRLCAEKKQELGIDEAEFFADKNRQLQTRRHMDSQLTQYREWLLGITILDPACGSGAFLNAAFKFLKSEHEKVFEMMKRITGYELPLDQIDNEILEHNLYGVDINEESVEIAQLALWLRTAKPRRKLNTLSENIKCGNSLISDPAIAGDKAFDWQKEFPQVFEKGGFDVVIGNPPYGAKVSSEEIKVFINSFSDWGISKNLTDTYFVFYAKSLNDLVKPGGLLGFIAPNTWKLIAAAKLFRNKLLNTNYEVYKIAQYQDKVFADATVDCDTVMVQKESNPSFIQIDFVKNHEIVKTNTINQNLLASQSFFNLYLTETDYQIKSKILKESRLVEDELIIKNGVKPYEKGKGTPPQTAETLKTKPFTSETKIDESFSPLIGGSYFHRYRIMWNNDYWIKYGEWLAAPREKSTFDAEAKLIFRQTSDSLIGSFIGKGYIMRNNTHIILPKDDTYDLKYVLACLNSKLLNYYYWTINPEKGEAMAEVKAFHLGLLPIKRLSKADQQPFITLADRMLSLNKELQEKRSCFQEILTANLEGVKITTALQTFDQMDFKGFVAELKKQKITIPLTQQNEWIKCFNQNKEACQALTQQISETDREIDTRVFDLYGLTPEEREIVMKG